MLLVEAVKYEYSKMNRLNLISVILYIRIYHVKKDTSFKIESPVYNVQISIAGSRHASTDYQLQNKSHATQLI